MNLKEIKNKVKTDKNYSFLWNNEYENILISLGGSWAYGTNTSTSDIDVRGIVMDPIESILGLSNFEQHEVHDKEKDVDAVLYGLKKMVKLLLGNNPNCIEIISPQERNIVFVSEVGRVLLENRHLFLSKKVAFTFGAYAKAQLDRLENAVCHDALSQSKQEEHMLQSILGMMDHFNDRFKSFEDGSVVLRIEDATNKEYEKEIVLDVNLQGYPLRDYKGMWSEMNNVVKDYSKLNQRNKKKDIPHLCKHMMHLVRLLLMGKDLLEKEEIITYREQDLDLLLSIRHGEYMNKDGTVKDSFYKLVDEKNKEFEHAAANTKLPEKPDFHAVEKMVMDINEQYLIEE